MVRHVKNAGPRIQNEGKRKELSTLTYVAAYKVAKYADSEREVKSYLNSTFRRLLFSIISLYLDLSILYAHKKYPFSGILVFVMDYKDFAISHTNLLYLGSIHILISYIFFLIYINKKDDQRANI